MRLWFEVNQHKERSIRTFNEKGSEVEVIICQVISITARLIVPFNKETAKEQKGHFVLAFGCVNCVQQGVYLFRT